MFRSGVFRILFLQGLLLVAIVAPAMADQAIESMSEEERAAEIKKLDGLVPLVEAVSANPGSVDVYKPLYREAVTMGQTNVKEPLCYTVALGLLYCGGEDVFKKQKAALARMYPNGRFESYLDMKNYTGKCAFCEGKGTVAETCPDCDGRKTCPNSKCEAGKITYRGSAGQIQKTCPVCKGLGKCPGCMGTGIVERKCEACGGKGVRGVKEQLKENVTMLADDTLVAIRVRKKLLAGQAKLGAINETGRQVTPPELKDRLSQFAQWMLTQQRRLDMKIVHKAYALHEGSRAVLYLVMHENFTGQDYDWRLSIAKACYMDWRAKCKQTQGGRFHPGLVMLDENDEKVGEYRPAEGKIWLPK